METSQHRPKRNTLKNALAKALQSGGIWEIRLETNHLPVTLETLADVYQKESRLWAYLSVASYEEVNTHFDQYFGLSKPFVIDEGENASTPKLIVSEDTLEYADVLDRPDDDDFENTDDDDDDDGGWVIYVKPTPEQYESWMLDIFQVLILPRCKQLEAIGFLNNDGN